MVIAGEHMLYKPDDPKTAQRLKERQLDMDEYKSQYNEVGGVESQGSSSRAKNSGVPGYSNHPRTISPNPHLTCE